MRLHERTLQTVRIAPRLHATGTLGGTSEAFSTVLTDARASVLPEDGGLQQKERGLVNRAALRLLVPVDTTVSVGDGVYVGEALYVVRDVQRWTAHLELRCEARA